jgi:uncharacterized Fe-S cluster protein YjdI
MDEIIKKYSNGEVTIVWKPEMCIHSRICWGKVGSLPEVFNPKERPWIKPGGASTERIIQQIKQCPSGALSYYLEEIAEIKNTAAETFPDTIIEPTVNGPLLVFGNITVKDKTGNNTQKNDVTAFCRCGASSNKPYCDGSHARVGFEG